MKSAILYFSQWGATKQYAEWIAEAVPGTDVIDGFSGHFDPTTYDAVIIATRVFMGQIAAKSYLQSIWDILRRKPVYLLVVGLSPQEADDSVKQYEMIPANIRAGLAGYHKVPGVIEMDKLNFILKKMIMMFSKKGEPIKTGGIDKSQILPVIEWLKKLA